MEVSLRVHPHPCAEVGLPRRQGGLDVGHGDGEPQAVRPAGSSEEEHRGRYEDEGRHEGTLSLAGNTGGTGVLLQEQLTETVSLVVTR